MDLEKQYRELTKGTRNDLELSSKTTRRSSATHYIQGTRQIIRRWFLNLTYTLVLMFLVYTFSQVRGDTGIKILQFLVADNKPAHELGYNTAELLLEPEKAEKLFLYVNFCTLHRFSLAAMFKAMIPQKCPGSNKCPCSIAQIRFSSASSWKQRRL